jgi:hypothetical protein
MGSQPDETEEPTASQLAALYKKVYTENRAPYCDFSVWTPLGRRMSQIQKCRVYTPLGDGSYLQKDFPGPGTHAAAACIMLNNVKHMQSGVIQGACKASGGRK